jgi:hypothetical protein
MSSPVQAHSKAIFRDSALGALVLAPSGLAFVEATPGVLTLVSGLHEDYVLADLGGTGVFTLVAKPSYDPATTRVDAVQVGATAHLY